MKEYDLDKMKRNIFTLLKKNGITQESLGDILGITQSRVSKILNTSNSDSFTIPQLVKIAKTFEVSVDDILGLESNDSTHETTLADICKILFDNDEAIGIRISELVSEYHDEDGYYETRTPAMYFTNEEMSSILEEWGDLSSANIKKASTKNQVLELWKKSKLDENSQRLKKWRFRTEYEQACYLSDEILNAPIFYNENDDIFSKEYIEKYNLNNNLFSEDTFRLIEKYENDIYLYIEISKSISERERLFRYMDNHRWNISLDKTLDNSIIQ